MPASDRKDGAVASVDSPVLVKDLTNAHQNPNIPRGIFAEEVSDATVNHEGYTSVTDATSKPGKDFSATSFPGFALKMKGNFDANGESGNAGDSLIYVNGHWAVEKA